MRSETVFDLSPREKQLLRRFAAGRTDAMIAVELGDRENRIAAQRKRLIEKLQIRSDDQLSAAADRFAPWSRREGWNRSNRLTIHRSRAPAVDYHDCFPTILKPAASNARIMALVRCAHSSGMIQLGLLQSGSPSLG